MRFWQFFDKNKTPWDGPKFIKMLHPSSNYSYYCIVWIPRPIYSINPNPFNPKRDDFCQRWGSRLGKMFRVELRSSTGFQNETWENVTIGIHVSVTFITIALNIQYVSIYSLSLYIYIYIRVSIDLGWITATSPSWFPPILDGSLRSKYPPKLDNKTVSLKMWNLRTSTSVGFHFFWCNKIRDVFFQKIVGGRCFLFGKVLMIRSHKRLKTYGWHYVTSSQNIV